MINIDEHLNKLTKQVRIDHGSGKAMAFYVDYIQPLKIYYNKEKFPFQLKSEKRKLNSWKNSWAKNKGYDNFKDYCNKNEEIPHDEIFLEYLEYKHNMFYRQNEL